MHNEEQTQILTDSARQTIISEAVLAESMAATDTPSKASPQVVYLDIDGAETAYYNRELDICVANVLVEDSGLDAAVISSIVADLNGQFGNDVVFTSSMPDDGLYSTIYIGVTSAFDEYGSFLGLAETIDSGNIIPDDNAFVLLDSTAATSLVTSVIAHEAGHIVYGYNHGKDELLSFAAGLNVNVPTEYDPIQTKTISKGRTENDTTIDAGVGLYVLNGGIANRTIITHGGQVFVSIGGVANSAKVMSDGMLFVYNKGIANSTTVNNMGQLIVSSGGTANGTTVMGKLIVCSGTANNTIVNSGNFRVSGGVVSSTIVNDSYFEVMSGGMANDTIINSAVMHVDGGIANSTTMNSGGTIYVSSGTFASSGGTANSTTLNAGVMWVARKGMTNVTKVNSGGILIASSGGILNNTTLDHGGSLSVRGGTVNNTLICSGGWMGVLYGEANSTIVKSGGVMEVNKGGILRGTHVIEGTLNVGADVDAAGATISLTISQRSS
ncbi:MAG: AIDA repeat-containing protein, partial [Victivallales bacterium]|nr:AIDA repeat-containing protein [Victivallales bacterium]